MPILLIWFGRYTLRGDKNRRCKPALNPGFAYSTEDNKENAQFAKPRLLLIPEGIPIMFR